MAELSKQALKVQNNTEFPNMDHRERTTREEPGEPRERGRRYWQEPQRARI